MGSRTSSSSMPACQAENYAVLFLKGDPEQVPSSQDNLFACKLK